MGTQRTRNVLAIFALLVLAIGVSAILHASRSDVGQSSAADSAVNAQASNTIAPPSAAVLKQLAQSKGFQALVSITREGFAPGTTTITQGQTIRFTNNGSRDAWIGQITDKNTPSSPNTQNCDVSFNSCHVLHPGDFSEFTFPTSGTFRYMDNLDPRTQGVVVVQ